MTAAMVTALAAQLASAAVREPRGKPSLLFSYQESAELDLETVHANAREGASSLLGFSFVCDVDARVYGQCHSKSRPCMCTACPLNAGFEQLCGLDARFAEYGPPLFDRPGVGREELTPEAAANLDAAISGFCQLLADYYLLPPCFMTLEYLVHRFK